MADISKITIESGTYDIKDEISRNIVNKLQSEVYIDCIYRGDNAGNCNLIRTENKNVLIDLGIESSVPNLITYLKTKAIKKIDYLIITHYHSDHIGGNNAEGFLSLMQDSYFDYSDLVVILPHKGIDWINLSMDDKSVIMTAETTIKNYILSNDISYIEVEDNEIINLESDSYLKFNNIGSSYYDHYYSLNLYNNFSLLTTLVHNDNKILFTADCEEEAQKQNAKNIPTNVSVVTAPHHDLNIMSDESFLKKLAPKYEVIMNLFEDGLPGWTGLGVSTQFSGYLKSIGTKVYTTNRSHNINILSKDNNILVYSDYGNNTVNSNMITIGNGIEIPNGTDINDLKQVGNYFTLNSANSATLLNLPFNYDNPGPIRITNTQIRPLSTQILQILHTPQAILVRQLHNGTDWDTWCDVLHNGLGIAPNGLVENDDFNNFFKAGIYEIHDNNVMSTLSNKPTGVSGGATLEVRRLRYDYDHIRQTLYCDSHIYYRTGYSSTYLTTADSLTWDAWSTVL